MNAVATQARASKMLVIAAVVVVLGWAGFSVLSESVRIALAGAFGGVDLPVAAAMAADGARPGCKLIGKIAADEPFRADSGGPAWQSLELKVLPGVRTSSDVGTATVSVEAADAARKQVRWRADIGIDALILDGPRGASIRHFEHEKFRGNDALDADSEAAGPIRSITFCYDFELTVNKDVNPEFTRVYRWKLGQSVEPARWKLSPGNSGTSTYRIRANRDRGTARDWRVYGTVTIDNLTPLDATLHSVRDETDDGYVSRVDCGVPLPGYILKSGASLTCEYQLDLPDGAPRRARVTVETLGELVRGSSAEARIEFADARVHEVADTIMVRDSSGRSWTFQTTGQSSYQRVFRCEEDAGLHPWAARIDGSMAGISTVVTVDCQPKMTGNSTARRLSSQPAETLTH
jgi:hypothetical protein